MFLLVTEAIGVIFGEKGVAGRTPHFISTPSQEKFCLVPLTFQTKVTQMTEAHSNHNTVELNMSTKRTGNQKHDLQNLYY